MRGARFDSLVEGWSAETEETVETFLEESASNGITPSTRISREDVIVEAGLLSRLEEWEVKPGWFGGLSPRNRGDLPRRAGVPLGVAVAELLCMAVGGGSRFF